MKFMHIERRHLRSIRAIHDQGGLARAAEALHITQSALSHQIKALEEQAGVELVVRRAKPMRLSAAGQRLLMLAQQVLPLFEAAEAELAGIEDGRAGRLHLALECHACFDWLMPVLEEFRRAWPQIDIDIAARLAFEALPALLREKIDLVITSDPAPQPEIIFQPLFDYTPTAVVAAQHKLAERSFLLPQDFADQTLLHYPVAPERIDAVAHFLEPAGCRAGQMRAVEMTDVMVMLAAAGRGIAVLPDWVLRIHATRDDIRLMPLGEGGLRRRLYAGLRRDDLHRPYMAHVLQLARRSATRLIR